MANVKLASENRNLTVELKIASQNCKKKNKTIESLKNTYSLAEPNHADFNSAVDNKIKEVREESEREVQRYKTQIIDLQSLIASLMKEKQQLKDVLENKEVVDMLQKENRHLNFELSKAKEMIQGLQIKLEGRFITDQENGSHENMNKSKLKEQYYDKSNNQLNFKGGHNLNTLQLHQTQRRNHSTSK